MKTNSAFGGSLIFFFTAGNLLGLSSVSAQLPSPSYFPEYFATQSAVPTPQPSFTVTKRRRINNCDKDWQRDIEAQAWADAGEIAEIADGWSKQKRDEQSNSAASPRKWQPAMDYFMGKDSINDDIEGTIELGLDNEQKIHHPNWIFPEAAVDIYCENHPTLKCTEKKNPFDPNGPKVTAYATSQVYRGTFWNSYNILLCPRFFYEKDSLWGVLNEIGSGRSDKNNASVYKSSWGHTIYHELMHLDPVISNQETWDVRYGACNVAKLASQAGCTGNLTLPGWNYERGKVNSVNNADSWALFASAAYFQNILELDAPGTAPDCDLSDPLLVPAEVEGILEPDGVMDAINSAATVPPDPRPDQMPAPDGPAPVMPIDPNSPPPGLATPYSGASAYYANLPDATSSSIVAFSSSSTAAPSQSGICQGNQINGACTGASYPTLAPDSGIQPPVCNKVDDPQNSLVRINSNKAKQAAADYCASLASNKIILGAGSDAPAPATIPGAAENNGQLALTVQFDIAGCPADKSSSTVDFTKMSSQECQQNFFTSISLVCAQDKSFPNYDPNFTLEGGVYLNDCGLFGMIGQP